MARSLSLQQRQERLAWAFLAPCLLILLVVGLYPLLRTFWLSFTDARMGSGAEVKWVWFQNYSIILKDANFWRAALNTCIFTVASVSIEFVIGLGVALAMNASFRGRGLLRAAILIPWALPTVVSAKMWQFMLVDTFGVINDLAVTKLGLFDHKIAWLAEPGLAMASIIAVDVWKTTPFVALLLLAGLQQIPDDVYEAAHVDGASTLQQFFTMTLPLLRPAIVVTLIFRTLDAIRVFDVIWVMTRGAQNTESLATYNYDYLYNIGRLGRGSAISVLIFILIAIFVAIYIKMLRVGKSEA